MQFLRFSPLALVIASAFSPPILAQGVAADTPLAEMVVTATKTVRPVREVPAAVTVIDRERIERSAAITVDQVLQGVPGIYAARMDVSSPNRIAQTYSRGLPGNGRTLVLVDGLPMNVGYDSQVDWSQLSTTDVERVEVVRGAGSALYGNSAMGGVINIISRIPKPGQQLQAEAEYGSLDTKRLGGHFSRHQDATSLILTATYLESAGYNMWRPDTSTASIPVSRRAKTGTEKTNAAAKLFHDIDNANALDFNLSYLRDLTTGLYSIPGYNAQDRQQYLSSARYRHFGEGSETSVLVFGRFGYQDADSANGPNTTSPDVAAPGVPGASRISYRGQFEDTTLGLNVQSSHTLAGNQKLTVGGEFSDSDVTMTNHYPAEPGREQVTKGHVKRTAVFLQDELRVGDLNINLVGRYDIWATNGRFTDTKATFPGQGSWGERSERAFSPKAGASYPLTRDLVVRGSIGKAFNTPDVSQLYGNSRRGTVVAFGNPFLTPEKALVRDIGLDYYLGKLGHLKSTLYYTTAEDFIYTLNRTAVITDKVNIGAIRAKGVELEAVLHPLEYLALQAGYTYNDSHITKFDQNVALVGKKLIYVPRHQGSLRADLILPFGLAAFAVANYVGDRFSSDANTAIYRKYTTYDLGLSKAISRDITARLAAVNVTDKKYEGIGYMAPGATVSAGLSIKF